VSFEVIGNEENESMWRCFPMCLQVGRITEFHKADSCGRSRLAYGIIVGQIRQTGEVIVG
jgi:hypothetical protein